MVENGEPGKFRKLLETMPKKHPFESAGLCGAHCYGGRPVYVTESAYDAFTYPGYDSGSQSFLYQHYDLEAGTLDDVGVDLAELLEADIGNGFVKAVEICNMFNVPMADIKICAEKQIFRSL